MTESTSTPDPKAITRTARDPATTAEQLQACAGQGESIDRLLAKHPNASAQLLEQLSHSSDRATRKAVTLHPNTPKDALLKLAPQFPGDFFQNPAFDWLLIEHPNLMFDIGGGVLKNVLKRAECPASFMAWAAAHGSEQERLAVAMNPQAQADVLQAIERKGGKAAQAAQQHANHPLASGEGDLESAFRKAVEQVIAQEFDAIQSTTLVRDLPTLAQWPALSVAKRLESSLLMGDCAAIAAHPGAPSALAEPILNALAASAHEGARWEVADQPGAPAAILAKLADDSDKEVRRAARAKRRAVETTIHTQLAFDTSCDGRFAFLCKSDTPAAVVTQRITSACEDAHRLVFDCKRSSWWVRSVAKLKPKDADLIQACNAGDVLFLPDRLADKACRKTELVWRLLGLSHRLASPEDLAKRSRSTEWVERMAVARNPNTPPNIIEALRKDPHRLVARQAEATALIKSGATERQAQLLQEMPAASTGPTGQALVEEANIRLRARTKPDLRLFGSRWAGCLGPQWLSLLDAGTQAKLEQVLPDSMKQAMAEFWVGASVPADEVAAVHLPSALALLAKRSRKEGVQKLVAASINAPAEVLGRLATSKFDDVRINVAANPATPAAVLAILSGDAAFLVRHRVAVNPSTPAETLTKLADDLTVRRRVAENPTTPIALLTHLAKDAEAWVRVAVAGNQSSPDDIRPGILNELASDADPAVRCAVAANPATPDAALAMLAADSSVPVRCAFAANPSAPADKLPTVLTALAGDEDAKVRKAAAENPATPLDVLIKLAGDDRFDVRERVAHNPATPADIAATLSAARAASMARNASRADVDVRLFVAQDLDTPPETLRTLAGDVSWLVCAAAVSNPNAPADILVAPTGDADADMRRSVMRRCAELRSALATESPTPEQSAAIQSWIGELQAGLAEPVVPKDVSDSEFRLAFDALGLMPPEGDKRAIAKAAKSKDWLERAAATYAPGIQPSLLKVLLEDPVEAVRQCAVARLRVVGA